jgi:phospholipase/carboxylesterase
MLQIYKVVPAKVTSAVLLLHGLGANGEDLIGLAEEWGPRFPNTAFFSPDAPEPCDMAPFGYQWFSLRDWTPGSIEAGLRRVKPIVDQLIDSLLKEYSLPASSFVLSGFSQGTMLSLYTGLQREEPLAGILAYSGALFGVDDNKIEIRSRPPVCLIHGTADEVVPFTASQIAAEQLKKHNIDTELHPISGVGHGIDSRALDLGTKFLQRVLTHS